MAAKRNVASRSSSLRRSVAAAADTSSSHGVGAGRGSIVGAADGDCTGKDADITWLALLTGEDDEGDAGVGRLVDLDAVEGMFRGESG